MSSISLSFPISDDRRVTVEADNPAQLKSMIDKLGGDGGEVADQIADALADPSRFVSVQVIPLTSATLEGVSPAESASSPSDPWADEDPGAEEPADDDPWSTPTSATTTASNAPSPSSSQNSEPQSASDSHENKVYHDRFQRKFHHGLPDAPTCDHNLKAAKMTAKKKSGKGNYSKWVCPKVCDGTSDGWKDKCSFEDWAS